MTSIWKEKNTPPIILIFEKVILYPPNLDFRYTEDSGYTAYFWRDSYLDFPLHSKTSDSTQLPPEEDDLKVWCPRKLTKSELLFKLIIG